MIGARSSGLGTVTCSVGGLGAGFIDPIVPSLRAGAAHNPADARTTCYPRALCNRSKEAVAQQPWGANDDRQKL
jgi:hypothetical protein